MSWFEYERVPLTDDEGKATHILNSWGALGWSVVTLNYDTNLTGQRIAGGASALMQYAHHDEGEEGAERPGRDLFRRDGGVIRGEPHLILGSDRVLPAGYRPPPDTSWLETEKIAGRWRWLRPNRRS